VFYVRITLWIWMREQQLTIREPTFRKEVEEVARL
jgi:hypothetical protein